MLKRLKTRDLKHNVYITYSGVSVNNFCAISSLGGGGPPTVGRWEGPSSWGEASRKAGNMKLKNACIMSMNKGKKIVARAIIISRPIFPKIIL